MFLYFYYVYICIYTILLFILGRFDFGFEGVRCFIREDVRGRVIGFVGVVFVLDEVFV